MQLTDLLVCYDACSRFAEKDLSGNFKEAKETIADLINLLSKKLYKDFKNDIKKQKAENGKEDNKTTEVV